MNGTNIQRENRLLCASLWKHISAPHLPNGLKCDEASRLSNPQKCGGRDKLNNTTEYKTAKFMCNSRKTNDLILKNKAWGKKDLKTKI